MGQKRHRVLFVSLFPPRVGGLALQSELLAHYLQKEGVEVQKANAHYARSYQGTLGKVAKAGAQVTALIRASNRGAKEVDQIVAAGCSWWGFMPVVVALIMGRRYGKPVSVIYHGGAAGRFLRVHHWWVGPMLRMADALAVNSHFLREEFAAYGIETMVVPPVVRFGAVKSRRRGLVLLSTRYLEPIYDVATILKAFVRVQAAFPNARLIVAGSGSQQRSLQGFALEHDLRVKFTGHLEAGEIERLLSQGSFYLNAALVDNFPTSVLEAMNAGTMVITTPVGELPRLMVHGTHGLFFVPGDAESLANTVLYALSHEEVAARCREEGQKLARSFTWDRVRADYLRLLRLNGMSEERRRERGSLEH
ncbi:MAG: glycosyltransferase family 4 protein [candidate division KSB1 bacterium]|nr:glycosyltransferase family 4 protein [candidate division KSB1 bacterium]MDZ7294414.1 glycosyltransferase family 4 protein [candidate division KSB1 bacterium]MDZ7377757.1 glycosyltransferase family 4 protein [candidate division KSB1 bacterium]MDZ7386723.1 glycosyltransferase family 4 protein [candidate division KSB1 bacterium]MDZ7392880.1 glycosyltransferase family 4 protein [candidate division KSB1 bacterium]